MTTAAAAHASRRLSPAQDPHVALGRRSENRSGTRARQLAIQQVASYLVVVGVPLIATSARRHDIRDNDMLHAFNHPIFVDDLDDGFVMFVGADGPIIVHAMPARPKYLR